MTETTEKKKETAVQQHMLAIRKQIKESAPLIHCITNPISIQGCANIILAAGARPIMAEHPAEVEEITAVSSALMLNLGNITDVRMESMQRSLRVANERNIPVLLDLVGVTCSRLRRDFAGKLLKEGRFSVIKGNISEILAAAGLPFHGTGIDAGAEDAISQANEIRYCDTAQNLAAQLGCTIMATGKEDLIADSHNTFLVSNGHAALSGITGTGCMVGALTAAYLPGCRENMFRSEQESACTEKSPGRGSGKSCFPGTSAALLAVITMGLAGEHAAAAAKGPGSFQMALFDEIYGLTDDQLLAEARMRHNSNQSEQ